MAYYVFDCTKTEGYTFKTKSKTLAKIVCYFLGSYYDYGTEHQMNGYMFRANMYTLTFNGEVIAEFVYELDGLEMIHAQPNIAHADRERDEGVYVLFDKHGKEIERIELLDNDQ